MEPNLSSQLLEKAQEAAKQYQRAELFWNCSSMTDEEISRHRQRFFDSYSNVLDDVIRSLFPENGKESDKEQSNRYLEKQGIASVLSLYQKQKSRDKDQRKSEGLLQDPKQPEQKQDRPLDDSSLTKKQRQGLQAFHQWMYRNCDRQGMKYLGTKLFGADGSARNFVDRFMSMPPKVQLRALYLLENDKRKNPDPEEISDVESRKAYFPDLNRLKDKMTASKWKFWKRTNGSYLYWHKLNEALEAAQEMGDAKKTEKKAEAEEKTEVQIAEEKKEESVEKWENAAEKPNNLSDINYTKELFEGIGLNTEKAIQHIKDGLQVKNTEELDGYMTRLVKKIHGEPTAKFYNNLSSAGLAGLTAVSGILSMIAGGKELSRMRHVQGTMSRVGDAVDLTTTGLYSAESLNSAAGSVADFFKSAETAVNVMGKVSNGIFGAANLLVMAKGGMDIAGGIKGKKHAEQVKALAKETGDVKMQNRGEFAKFLNAKKRNRGVRGFIQGSAGVVSAGISLFGAAVPVVGQVAGLAAVSMTLYETYVQKNKDLQEKYRKGIDAELFDGGKALETADKALVDTFKARMEKLDSKSESYKKLKELCQDNNKEKRFDILRKEKAAEKNCIFLRDCYEKTINEVGDEAYRNVFYIDPDKGGTFKNLITAENYHKYFTLHKIEEGDTAEQIAEKNKHNKQVAVRMSYKELMESFGAKAEFLSERSQLDEMKKKNKEMTTDKKEFKRSMEDLAENRKKQVVQTFGKM